MELLSYTTWQRSHPQHIFFASPQSGATAPSEGTKRKEHMEAPKGAKDQDAKTKFRQLIEDKTANYEDVRNTYTSLKQQGALTDSEQEEYKKLFGQKVRQLFERDLASLNEKDLASLVHDIPSNPDIDPAEKAAFNAALLAMQSFIQQKQKRMLFLMNVGSSSLISAEKLQQDAQQLERDLPPLFINVDPAFQKILKQHAADLISVTTLSAALAENLEALKKLASDYYEDKTLTENAFLQRWKIFKQNILDIYNSASTLQGEYAQIPFLSTNLFITSNPKLHGLMQYGQLLEASEYLETLNREIPNKQALEKKLASDFGKTKLSLKPGSVFVIGKKRYRVLMTTADKITMYGKDGKHTVTSPAELYMALVIESNQGGNDPGPLSEWKDKKINGHFIPALHTVEDLSQALKEDKLLPENENLEEKDKNIALQTAKGKNPVILEKFNPSKQEVYIAHSKRINEKQQETWKGEIMSYQDFYNFWKTKKLSLKEKTKEESRSTSPLAKTMATPQKKRWMSIAAVVQSVKWIRDSVKRMAEERSQVDASNFSKSIAHYLDKVPWMRGIENISIAANNSIILEVINKWVKQYGDGIATGEFHKQWEQFNKRNKIQQAALVMAAMKKGLSKEEVFKVLGGDLKRCKNPHRPNHSEYVDQVIAYFCTGPGALPEKYESQLTALVGDCYDNEVKTGYKEGRDMVTADEILQNLRYYAGTPGSALWKRMRPAGAMFALLKLGCSAEEFGTAQLWFFRLVESARGNGKEDANNWSVEMMRKFGNMGKAYGPMLGLFRFPAGMGIARAMIDFYTQQTGENPFTAGSDAEHDLSLCFAGQFGQIEKEAKESNYSKFKDGKEGFERFRYLYLKARMFGLHMTGAASFSYEYIEGAYLDEGTLADAYGIGGMLSDTWLETILETETNGQPKQKWDVHTAAWWNKIKPKSEEWNNITEGEKIIFAHNFAKALNHVQNPSYYFEHYLPTILHIFKYLRIPPEKKIVCTDDKHDKHTYTSITELESELNDKNKHYDVTKIKIEDSILNATINSLDPLTKELYISRINPDTDLNVRDEIVKNIKESKNHAQIAQKDIQIVEDELEKYREQLKSVLAASDKEAA